MTRAEWDALDPREKDALVAEKVMGFEKRDCISRIDGDYLGWLWFQDGKERGSDEAKCNWFTTSWDAMREVVEKMQEDCDVFLEFWGDREWTVANHPVGFRDAGYVVTAATLPEAVCIAALTALGHITEAP